LHIEVPKISGHPPALPWALLALPTQMATIFLCYQKRNGHEILEIVSFISRFYAPKISGIKNKIQKRK